MNKTGAHDLARARRNRKPRYALVDARGIPNKGKAFHFGALADRGYVGCHGFKNGKPLFA